MYLYRTEWTEYDEKNLIPDSRLDLCDGGKGTAGLFFTHYSSEDGLSQNTVMGILQDYKGNMWFATWNGLNKFDGYSFKVYKAKLGSQIALTNDRMDQICEDKFGFLWLQTYDNHAYRFDPSTERFERVPAENEPGSGVAVTSIHVLPGGSVWLFTEKKEPFA